MGVIVVPAISGPSIEVDPAVVFLTDGKGVGFPATRRSGRSVHLPAPMFEFHSLVLGL